MSAKVASLTEEVERLKKENKNVDVLQAEIVELKAKEKKHFDHVIALNKALFEQVEANKMLNRKVSKIMQGVLQVHENDLKLVLESLNLKSTYQGSYSCRSEDPVRRDEGDKDNDPAPSQPPNTGTNAGKSAEIAVETSQGESSSGAADKGKGKEVVHEEMMIDALIDLERDIDFDDKDEFVKEIDVGLKDDEFELEPCMAEDVTAELDENLEEGEWVPPKDFAEKNWDDLIYRSQIERMVVETVIAMQSKRSFANPDLRKEFEDRTVKKSYKNRIEAVGKILSWAYDQYLDVFMIKRLDGIQYLKRSIRSFNQLPLCELRVLAEEKMINNSDDMLAAAIKNNLVKEVRIGVYDYIKPQKLKRIKIPNDIDWITRKPRVRYEYKPVKSLKRIPLRIFGFDIMRSLKYWYLDSNTTESVFVNEDKKEILRMLDPLKLVNFSEDDLLILQRNRIEFHKDHEVEARQFQRVVDVCVQQKIHAGSHLPSRWAE